jgi:hypothetical protein
MDDLEHRILMEIRNAESAYYNPTPRWREVASERIVKLVAARIAELEALTRTQGAMLDEVVPALQARADRLSARIAELEAERDALASDRRMIVSHATAGETDGRGMSVNEVSVRITMLRNRLWNDAKAPAEARADRLSAMLREAERAVKRIERALTYPVSTEINPQGWALRPRGDIEFAATELRALLARLEAREVEG